MKHFGWVKVDYCPLVKEEYLTFWKLKRLNFKGYQFRAGLRVLHINKKSETIEEYRFVYDFISDLDNLYYRKKLGSLEPLKGAKASELLFSEDPLIRKVLAGLKWESE